MKYHNPTDGSDGKFVARLPDGSFHECVTLELVPGEPSGERLTYRMLLSQLLEYAEPI